MNRKLNRKKHATSKTSLKKKNARRRGARYDDESRAASKSRFLAAHGAGASTRKAALIAGVDRATIYRWRDEDPDFAQAWRESRDKTMEDLEVRAYKRAIEGNDRLLMFLLKSHMPLTYNKRQQPIAPDKSQGFSVADIAERLRQCS